MSTLKVNKVQVGQSNTTTQNFSLEVPAAPDGTIKLARGLAGATTQDVLTVDASGKVTAPQGFIGDFSGTGSNLTNLPSDVFQSTSISCATSTGTIDLSTSIPSTAKLIVVSFVGVSTSGANPYYIQVGNTAYVTTGYTGNHTSGTAVISSAYNGTGFQINSGAAANTLTGNLLLSRLGSDSNTWVISGNLGHTGGNGFFITAGSVSLAGGLDRIRLYTTDLFDGGNVSVTYEV